MKLNDSLRKARAGTTDIYKSKKTTEQRNTGSRTWHAAPFFDD